MARDLVIYGVGGMGQEVAELVEAGTDDGGGWRLIGFIDDDPAWHGQQILGFPVLGDQRWLSERSLGICVALGAPARRRHVWAAIQPMATLEAPALIHPHAAVGRSSHLGAGTIVGAGAILTADVTTGDFVIVNVGATVSHNCRLADFATLGPGVHLAGNVRVEEGADLGTGAVVIPGRTVGAWSRVGAGAVVTRDVDPALTVVGCPARPLLPPASSVASRSVPEPR